MRALSLPVGVLAAALLASQPGCGGKQKELPKVVTTEDTKSNPPPTAFVPAKSESAAVAIAEKAIKASTEGHPERLEKAKASRVTMKGVVTHPNRQVATDRKIEAVWPDRISLTDEFNDGGPLKVLMRLRRPVLWTANQRDGITTPVELGDPKVYESAFATDAVGRHWLVLLLPLADPKTVVFDAKKQTVNGETADVIKMSVPGSPVVYTLWCGEKTGQLRRIDFAQLEPTSATPTQKVFSLEEFRLYSGLLLPGRIVYLQNAIQVETWTIGSWEFPERLDDAGFDALK
ncbi:MAG TPA: hypothetical protein VH092_15140 [Urbifossiella sp.]|jgi:hypothetical protein|nr:hypothetical protein [Urbifossiella sp.]